MPRIVVVGSLNMDLVVRTPRLPAPGETIIGHEFFTAPGGKGANQAVAAARLGADVTLIGRVGADDFGHALYATLDAAHINAHFVTTDTTAATGIAVIEVEDSGQNTIVGASGANERVSPADIDAAKEAIQNADALLAQLETPLDATRHALALARAAGVMTILNPAPAMAIEPDVMKLVDVLIPNETEAGLLTGVRVSDWDSAATVADLLQTIGARAVIITLGIQGALFAHDGQRREIEAYPVEAIDATAAGDAFVAAFAVARASGQDWDAALKQASAAGALATTKLGAQPSMPTRTELEKFMSSARG